MRWAADLSAGVCEVMAATQAELGEKRTACFSLPPLSITRTSPLDRSTARAWGTAKPGLAAEPRVSRKWYPVIGPHTSRLAPLFLAV